MDIDKIYKILEEKIELIYDDLDRDKFDFHVSFEVMEDAEGSIPIPQWDLEERIEEIKESGGSVKCEIFLELGSYNTRKSDRTPERISKEVELIFPDLGLKIENRSENYRVDRGTHERTDSTNYILQPNTTDKK